jgi:hypothetical protein
MEIQAEITIHFINGFELFYIFSNGFHPAGDAGTKDFSFRFPQAIQYAVNKITMGRPESKSLMDAAWTFINTSLSSGTGRLFLLIPTKAINGLCRGKFKNIRCSRYLPAGRQAGLSGLRITFDHFLFY